MSDIILSIDFETYGTIPGVHSAASIGVVAYQDYKEVDSFYGVFKPLSWTKPDPDTMAWWKKYPDAWEEINTNQEEPNILMANFYDWGMNLPGDFKSRVFAANPNTFDVGFLTFYCYRYAKKFPVNVCYRLRCLDIRSYFACLAGVDYSKAERYKMPPEWFGGESINHRSIDDARQQGQGLMAMMKFACDLLPDGDK